MTIIWNPDADLPLTFDFSNWDELLSGTEKIVSAVVPSVTGLVIGVPSINSAGTMAQVRVSGGTDGTTYHLECKATTTSGYTMVGCGQLKVVAC